jgi:hypothetical protein
METQGIDTCALTAVFHRLLPGWAMRALPGCSENRQVHAQVGGLTLKQAGDSTMRPIVDPTAQQGGSPAVQQIGGSTLQQVEPGHERVSISGPGHLRSAEGAGLEQSSGSVPVGTMASQFDMTPLESTRERHTVLTQLPQESLVPAKDADTLRLTYPFRSWQGQPVAMVSFNFHEAGRRLRVEAPDRGVYAALLANRSALPGTVRIVDGDRHSHGHDGRRPEEGE